MGWQTLRRALLLASITALAVVPGTALGAKPIQQFHDHFTDSVSGVDVCGVTVDINVVVTDNFFVHADDSFTDTSSVRQTFTNPANGKSVILSSAGQVTGPPPIIDQAAGTITFRMSFIGLPEKIQTAQGAVLLRDAGLITFVDTFDLTTFEFISEQVIVHGPHPEADSGFTLFCRVISGALT
jgi:hypothetical protein